MLSVMPVGLLVSVFLLMFLFLKHLAVHAPCQDYFGELAIVSMSAQDPLMLREFRGPAAGCSWGWSHGVGRGHSGWTRA